MNIISENQINNKIQIFSKLRNDINTTNNEEIYIKEIDEICALSQLKNNTNFCLKLIQTLENTQLLYENLIINVEKGNLDLVIDKIIFLVKK